MKGEPKRKPERIPQQKFRWEIKKGFPKGNNENKQSNNKKDTTKGNQTRKPTKSSNKKPTGKQGNQTTDTNKESQQGNQYIN